MNRIIQTIIGVALVGLVAGWPSASLCAQDGWQEHRGRHFIIYYRNAPEDFVKTVEETAEQYYEEITNNLGFFRSNFWTWDDRAKIYIYEDAEDYYTSARQARWSHGVASARQKTIHTFPTMHGFFDSTLPHELGHIIFREFVGFNTPIPLWMDEGVAMYQEKAKRWGANQQVKQAIREGKFIPLDKLSYMRLTSQTPKELVELFYAEAASVVYFLITEFGEYKFVNFCRYLKEGKPFTSALKAAYYRFESFDDLNEAWLEYLKRN